MCFMIEAATDLEHRTDLRTKENFTFNSQIPIIDCKKNGRYLAELKVRLPQQLLPLVTSCSMCGKLSFPHSFK